MENKWTDDEGNVIDLPDPFTQNGLVRLLVVRHNYEYSLHGKTDRCTDIVFVQSFEFGFKNKVINSRERNKVANWIDSSVRDECDRQVNHLMKELKNGVYELIADFFSWESSYDGEHDGEVELRNIKIREISFADAIKYSGRECSLYENVEFLFNDDKENLDKRTFYDKYDIHYYMPKKDILKAQVESLTYLIEGAGNHSYKAEADLNKKSVDELTNIVDMLMLQIDSESGTNPTKHKKAMMIDEKVYRCLKLHNRHMDPES